MKKYPNLSTRSNGCMQVKMAAEMKRRAMDVLNHDPIDKQQCKSWFERLEKDFLKGMKKLKKKLYRSAR